LGISRVFLYGLLTNPMGCGVNIGAVPPVIPEDVPAAALPGRGPGILLAE